MRFFALVAACGALAYASNADSGELSPEELFKRAATTRGDQGAAVLDLYFASLADHPLSHMALGDRHRYGRGVPKSCESSVSYYQRAAEHTVRDALEKRYLPANLRERVGYSNALWHSPSKKRDNNVVAYYSNSASHGDSSAAVLLGEIFFYGAKHQKHDFVKAQELLSKGARLAEQRGFSGEAHGARAKLASINLWNLANEPLERKEERLKFAWGNFTIAAEAGHAEGLNGLGLMRMQGWHVSKDLKKAIKLFKEASKLGNSGEALYNLGAALASGLGVQKDVVKAAHYFSLAGQKHNIFAMYALGLMNLNGIGTIESCENSLQLFKSVSERGFLGLNLLSQAHDAYDDGEYDSALELYLMGAEAGYEVAASNAAALLQRGYGSSLSYLSGVSLEDVVGFSRAFDSSTLDEPLRLELLERSALQGNVASRRRVAEALYVRGRESDALREYRVASDLKDAEATFQLGVLHARGIGESSPDLHLSKRYLDAAARMSPDAALPVRLALVWIYSKRLWNVFSKAKTKFFSREVLERAASAEVDDEWVVIVALAIALVTVVYVRYNRARRTYEAALNDLH